MELLLVHLIQSGSNLLYGYLLFVQQDLGLVMEISQSLYDNEHADMRLELQSMDHIPHLFVLLG